MQKKILVVGSLAYDNLMQYDGRFRDIIVNNNFNIAITARDRHVGFGGCAGNISYNLRLLKEQPKILSSAGADFGKYEEWLQSLDADTSAIYKSPDALTAAAFIVTDQEQNQIITFEPGAMNISGFEPELKSLPDFSEINWAIISPDCPERMLKMAQSCKDSAIPYLLDPAQQIPNLKNEDLMRMILNCTILVVNDYESSLLAGKLSLSGDQLSGMVPNYIETHGPKGCSIKTPDGMFYVKAVKPLKEVDPTGCGDAFRAGVIAGLMRGMPLQRACQMGSLTATYNLENPGTQTHKFTIEEFAKRFLDSFGEEL